MQTNQSAQHLTWIIICFTISVNKAISTISNQIFYRFSAKVCTDFNKNETAGLQTSSSSSLVFVKKFTYATYDKNK